MSGANYIWVVVINGVAEAAFNTKYDTRAWYVKRARDLSLMDTVCITRFREHDQATLTMALRDL